MNFTGHNKRFYTGMLVSGFSVEDQTWGPNLNLNGTDREIENSGRHWVQTRCFCLLIVKPLSPPLQRAFQVVPYKTRETKGEKIVHVFISSSHKETMTFIIQ